MIQQLSQAGALSVGAKIWVLPDRAHSEWAQYLDWYLNFQMMRAERRTPRTLDEGFHTASKEWEFELDQPITPPENASLLIAAHQFLPCEVVLQVNYLESEGVAEWVKRIVQHWRALNADSLRIFLPKGVDLQTFEKNWGEPGSVGVLNDKDREA